MPKSAPKHKNPGLRVKDGALARRPGFLAFMRLAQSAHLENATHFLGRGHLISSRDGNKIGTFKLA